MSKIEITPEVMEANLQLVLVGLSAEEYSAYGIHTVLNLILVANGREKIRPQMMYNYLRNGLIVKGQKIFGETLRTVTRDEAATFLVRYCIKNGIDIKFTAADVNPDQLALDLEDVTE
jgi:hypothetical protein